MSGITTETIRSAASAIAEYAETAAGMLNEADGKLGDGDLGITVKNGWREVADSAHEYPADLGMAFLGCSKSFQKASSSSFGTLVATAFMSCAKECKGNEQIPWSQVGDLLQKACEAMMSRGKGQLGDKSVLDVVSAMSEAARGVETPDELIEVLSASVDDTLSDFRNKPNKLGRARMFGDKSVGLDDPGMLAVKVMVEALNRQ